ncbi:MAG: phosphoribosyltransferase [Aigarchaeota archaeon]|nr:phosphoribosyltransferase [Candidatus Pelearchaeum maunauluense]
MERITATAPLAEAIENLRQGNGVKIIQRGNHKILRIEWLNLFNAPQLLNALSEIIANECRIHGYKPDAVASIETSGAKYGVAVSLKMGIPYFSIHKVEKIIFLETICTESKSITEDRAVQLFIDRPIVSKFSRILLVDDIRRTSNTIDNAVNLLRKSGCEVEACFTILDFRFAGHPLPETLPPSRYHPLIIISEVYDDGRCVVELGEALKYL